MIVKLALNKKGKIIVVEKRSKRQKTTKASKYEKYVTYARQSKVDYILTEGEYKTTEIRNRNKGRKVTPEIVVRWQIQEGHTDKQIKAMVKAAKFKNPNITRAQFVRERGWDNIDREATALYSKLKAENPEMSSTDIGHIISQQIYGSP